MSSEAATVTLLFTDLVGSTELKSRLGDERAEELRRTHFRLLRNQIAAHRGNEVKSLGDGLMVAFGSASDAVACAVAMQQSIDRQNVREPEGELGVRIGLHCGEVTRDEDDYFGTPVDVAKRLCDNAHGGKIFASALVRGMVGSRGAFGFRDLGELQLKGVGEPVLSYEVTWERAAPEPVPLPPAATLAAERTPYAGRGVEREQLRGAFKLAQTGRRQLVLLAGEPGIGKTRLALEFARSAHEDGATVLFGRCDEEALLPYQPFVEALRFYAQACEPDELRAQVTAAGAEFVRLVPEVGQRLPGLPEPPPGAPETDRYRLFEAVERLLVEAARNAPLVLVLDDLHWADKPTLLLLRHIARATEPVSLLVLGTYRDTELARTHPLEEFLADLVRDHLYERIAVRGLEDDDVVSVLESAAQQDIGRRGRALAHALRETTEGNPFFMEQVMGHLVETGRVYQKDGVWTYDVRVEELGLPEGVKQVVGRRLSRLSEAGNGVLGVASVVGQQFDIAILERLTDQTADELVELLEDAVAKGVVREVPSRLDHYAFTHALVRQTLHDELTTSRRVRLHRRTAQALEDLHGADLEPYLSELAYHFGEAAEGGDLDKAVDYARRAGDQAIGLLAFEEAASHYDRALQALELADTPDEAARGDLLVALSEALRGAGETNRAVEVSERVIELGRRQSLPELFARAVLAYLEARWLRQGFGPAAAGELYDLTREALDGLGEAPSPLHAQLLARVPWILAGTLPTDELIAHATRASDMAESLNDAPARVAALRGMAWALWGPGHTDDLSRVARELVDIAEPAGDAAQAFFGHLWTLVAQARRGEMDAVDQEIEELTARADRLRSPSFAWWGPALHAMRALMDGRFEEAERLGGEALGIGQNFEAQWTLGQFGALLFGIRFFQGRIGELEEAVRAQMALNPDVINWPLGLAHLLAEEGRIDEARSEFDALAERDFADIPRNPAWQLTFWQLTEICALLGDARRARILYDRAPSDDSEVIFLGPGIVCAGATARSLGLLATTMSRWDDAERHFEAAIDLESHMDAPPYLARTQFEYARMLLMRGTPGDRERAAELLERATTVARELGMRSLIERSEPLLAEVAHA